ncbi:rod shape-determining protein MreD [Dermatobacter hominis]|uniref:rod shape-determining protein MreD n=1 Tax=Dermatobacter hominis TaxID=2884263 RepID=UPI001D105766|nr:rod shape-determining protein MreD [Dermatobacter hominis]UDY35714.1 rod shape-determining protein MreD [Dermatobacter hominis]
MIEGSSLIRWVLLVTATLVLQIGLATQIRVAGVHPDLLLLVAICAGLVGGPSTGAGVGFACGLLFDLFLPGRFGVTALAYLLVGYGSGVAGDAVARPTRWISAGIVALASAAGTLVYAAIGQLLGQRSLSDPNLGAIVGIVAAFNALLAVPVLAVCRWAEPEDVRLRAR